MTEASAADQINQLTQALTAAYTQKADAQAAIEEADKKIVAIRNVMAGVQLGQKLAAEMNPSVPPEPVPVL